MRSNEEWRTALAAPGEARERAVGELRAQLIQGLRRALRGRADISVIEDGVQEALVTILDGLGAFRGESRFLTWAMAIATHAVWTELRRRRWRGVSLDSLLRPGAVSAATIAPAQERSSQRSQLLAELERLIHEELTARQRAVILAELAGMPQTEIARRLGTNRNALYKLAHDARRRLARGLRTAGYGGDHVGFGFETQGAPR